MKGALFLFLIPIGLQADGGKLILRATQGAETLSVFADPYPLRAHQPCDLSVLVQQGSDPVLAGSVQLRLGSQTASATHAAATNKLLFAATLTPPQPGITTVTATHNGNSISAPIAISTAYPAALDYWPYFVPVPIAILLFALNRHLQRRRQRLTSA